MAKIELDRAYLVPYPNGLREAKGPGEVDENELPEGFVKSYKARQKSRRGTEAGRPLPGDFPGRRALEAAGIRTVEQAREMDREKLVKIDGIGDTTADLIRLAANGREAEAKMREVSRNRGADPDQEKAREEAEKAEKKRNSGSKSGGSKEDDGKSSQGQQGGDSNPTDGG